MQKIELAELFSLREYLNTLKSIFPVVNSELLWMAPEILRNYPPRKASQPGDVYSFAIILYEMCTRNEPYVTESWYQSLEGKITISV